MTKEEAQSEFNEIQLKAVRAAFEGYKTFCGDCGSGTVKLESVFIESLPENGYKPTLALDQEYKGKCNECKSKNIIIAEETNHDG